MPTGYSKNRTAKTRLTEEMWKRLQASHRRHNTTDSSVLEALISSYLESVEEADAVRLPLTVLLAEKQLLVAEDKTGPGKGVATTPAKPPDKSQRHRGDGPRRAV